MLDRQEKFDCIIGTDKYINELLFLSLPISEIIENRCFNTVLHIVSSVIFRCFCSQNRNYKSLRIVLALYNFIQ